MRLCVCGCSLEGRRADASWCCDACRLEWTEARPGRFWAQIGLRRVRGTLDSFRRHRSGGSARNETLTC